MEKTVGTGQINYRPEKSRNFLFSRKSEKICAKVVLDSALNYHLQALHLSLTCLCFRTAVIIMPKFIAILYK